MKRLFLLFILVLILIPCYVKAENNPVLIYEFYGHGCPHCTNSFVWFDYIEEEYGKYFDLVKYEVWYNEDNSNAESEELIKKKGYFYPYKLLFSEPKVIIFCLISAK